MITKNLPLTDLHRHLDGNIRTKTILELGQRFGVALPAGNIEELTPHVQIVEAEPSLVAFLSKLDWGVAVLGDLDACPLCAWTGCALPGVAVDRSQRPSARSGAPLT